MTLDKAVVFNLGDTITVCLATTTITGCLVREDNMGITIQDIKNKKQFRLVPWERVVLIEYMR